MNLTKYYGKNITPSCKYCLHCGENEDGKSCDKGNDMANGSCKQFKYEPTMREPKTLPALTGFKPEDFQI